jgi:hypothetical protein
MERKVIPLTWHNNCPPLRAYGNYRLNSMILILPTGRRSVILPFRANLTEVPNAHYHRITGTFIFTA